MRYLFILIILLYPSLLYAKNYSDKEICQAIYIIEGKENAIQAYGINPQYFQCQTKEKCKVICLNTVKNNRQRFKEYGYKKYGTYLEFLQSRYCPLSENKCVNWLPNLKFYLERG